MSKPFDIVDLLEEDFYNVDDLSDVIKDCIQSQRIAPMENVEKCFW